MLTLFFFFFRPFCVCLFTFCVMKIASPTGKMSRDNGVANLSRFYGLVESVP